ncbi:MAG: PepSY-associated TM helix domain-containing protein, partial [Pseudolabrys sp.]
GIWLWWPRGGDFLRGLRWRRSSLFTFNLHHLLGFWISLPLAVVSATGIYLSFPQTAREAMSSIAPMTPQGQRGFGQVAQRTALTADQVLAAALMAEPNGKPVALFLPVQQRDRPLTWRMQISRAGSGEIVTVTTDDSSGKTSPATEPLSGDRAASWIRWIHEGSHSGLLWAIIVTLTGIVPTIFAVTGVIMWLRKRSDRKELAGKGAKPRLRPAE